MSLDLNDTVFGDTPVDDWHEYADGVSFRVSRLDNPQYQIGIERFRRFLDRQSARLFGNGDALSKEALDVGANDKTEYQVQAELMSKYLLLDWKGVTEGGKKVEYTPERGYKLLIGQPKVFSWVIAHANKMKISAQDSEDESLGKSKRSSATS
ncbi:MAG TPA: hypothetical protein VFM75_11400 [Modicisalibacter sp.]|nr:hypothetical protein [Modicisalibacter sp.]